MLTLGYSNYLLKRKCKRCTPLNNPTLALLLGYAHRDYFYSRPLDSFRRLWRGLVKLR